MNEPVLKGTATDPQTRSRNHERSLGEVINDVKEELKSFINTRIQMVKAEFRESGRAAKVGLPLIVLSLGLLAIASLLLTAAVVVLVASAFAGNPYAWFFAFVIVGFLWAALGAMAGYFAVNQFRGRFPKRTMEVLRADKVWLQTEMRSHS
jgi:uncharacterized membrane protein YqjE